MADTPSFSVNKETIGLVMAIVGVLGVGITTYNWLLAGRPENSPVVTQIVDSLNKNTAQQALKDQQQDVRLDRTDRDRDRNTEAIKDQTTETQKLKEAVVKLTTVIETGGLTKKAELHLPTPGAAEELNH